MSNDRIRIIASPKSWIEGEAVRQLTQSLELSGMEFVVGLPDLHPGKGNPIGAAFVSRGRIYPFLVGSDIGCGIGLWSTTLARSKMKRDRWAKRLSGLDAPWPGKKDKLFEHFGLTPQWEESMGTIGGGNHFAELQLVESIEDANSAAELVVSTDKLVLLVHSGSRGLGDSILRSHVDKFGARGVDELSGAAINYMRDHDTAMRWAAANRQLIATRFLEALSTEGTQILDLCHNSVVSWEFNLHKVWLHRKGAAPSDQGPVVIPGSRGALSYLVLPVGEHSLNANSIAHGAGRKWSRSAITERLKGKVTPSSLVQTELGSLVICRDKDLLFEEAPAAYKSIDRVIEDLKEAGLIKVIAVLRPIITYKTDS